MNKKSVNPKAPVSKLTYEWVLLIACSAPLIGCQTPVIQNLSTATSTATLDKPSILTTASYRQQVTAAKTAYQQQFANPQGLSVDSEARSVLLKAIQQHLSTDHVAVTETRIHDRPFIQEGSVDTLAESIYVTLIKMGQEYITNKSAYGEDDAGYDDDYDDDHDEQYDSDVFYGEAYRTKDDYLEASEASNLLDDKKSTYQCTNVMLDKQDSLAAKGITYANGPDVYAEVYADNVACLEEAQADKEAHAAQNKALYSAEAAVQDEAQDDETDDSTDDSTDDKSEADATKEAIDMLLGLIKLSPQQLEANNFYRNQYQTLTRISEFNATNRQINDIYSYHFASPSALYTVQLPIALDFNQAKMIIDPSAFMPILAIATPENAPTLEEMSATTVAFNLPDDIAAKLPTQVVYDAFIEAIGYSLSELDSGYFTLMTTDNDAYAQEVGASSVIKVHLDAQQTGKMLGVMVKRMANTLQEHVTAHPEDFSDIDNVHAMLKKWQELNSNYQTDDVGALFQLVEAVAPISFNKVNYYYLDNRNQLLAKQTRRAIGSGLMGVTADILSQTRFDKRRFDAHPLYPLFVESYGVPFTENEPTHLKGNDWLEKMNQRNNHLELAQMARDAYYEDDADADADDMNSDNSKDAIDIDPNDTDPSENEAYQPNIRIVDFGNVNETDDKDIDSDDSIRNDIMKKRLEETDRLEKQSF